VKRNGRNQVMRGALLIALMALPFPMTAGAQSAAPEIADAPLGITVTGIGFAGTEASAAAQAIRDATDRAATVAATFGVEIGTIESVEMPELTQFTRFSDNCKRAADRRASLCRRKAAATIVTFGIRGGATGDIEAMRTVTADNTASVSVEQRDRPSDKWVKRAIATAREEAMKSATAGARQNAWTAAAAADLKLGSVVSVAETAPSPSLLPFLDLGFRDPLLGFFGPGTYCGIVRRATLRRDPETGKRRIVRVKRRRCVVPSTYETQMEVRYAVS
jgi:hypothetical protein